MLLIQSPQKECPTEGNFLLWYFEYFLTFTWLKKWICFLSHLHFYLTKQRLDSGGCALCARPTLAVGGLLFNCLDKCTKIKIGTISNPSCVILLLINTNICTHMLYSFSTRSERRLMDSLNSSDRNGPWGPSASGWKSLMYLRNACWKETLLNF